MQQKLQAIRFLSEYSKGPNRTFDIVANKTKIETSVAKTYLQEFIRTVLDSIKKGKYPTLVLQKYNKGVEDESKRLLFFHVNGLKDIVTKYSKNHVSIAAEMERQKNLNMKDTEKYISNNNSMSVLPIDNTNQPQQQQKFFEDEWNDIDKLKHGITPMQLIRFGLMTLYGTRQVADKVAKMIGDNIDVYLHSEAQMRTLLNACGIKTASDIETYIGWLKTNAHYVTYPTGFLALSMNPQAMGHNMANQQQGQWGMMDFGMMDQNGGGGNNDQWADYFYKMGVYTPGFPPNHPINTEALKKWRAKKEEDEKEERMDKRMDKMWKLKMMDVMEASTGNKQSSGIGGMSPEMLVLMGMGEYVNQTGPDGHVESVFRIKGPNSGLQPQQDPTTALNSQMEMFKNMVSFMNEVKGGSGNNGNNPNGYQSPQDQFMSTLMQEMGRKFFEKPEDEGEKLLNTIKLIDQIKGGNNANAMGNGFQPIPPDVMLKMKQMELNAGFANKRINLEQEKIRNEQIRLQKQDDDAKGNLEMIKGTIEQFGPTLLALGQQLFAGNKGGVPGAAGANPLAGMLGGNMGQGGMMGMGPAGMQPPGGMMQSPTQGLSPQEVLLKMEFERQQQIQQEEAQRRQQQWEEEQRERQKEGYGTTAQFGPNPYGQPQPPQQQNPYINNPMPQQQYAINPMNQIAPPDNDRQETTIVQRHDNKAAQYYKDPEEEKTVFTEEDFANKSLDDLKQYNEMVNKELQKVLSYKNSVEAVMAKKMMSGDNVSLGPSTNDFEFDDTQQEQEEQENSDNISDSPNDFDVEQALNMPSQIYDPDYDGTEPSSENKEEEGEEVDI